MDGDEIKKHALDKALEMEPTDLGGCRENNAMGFVRCIKRACLFRDFLLGENDGDVLRAAASLDGEINAS